MTEMTDLWAYLQKTKKHIVLYGMGNGADKILSVCEQKNIAVDGFFASDDFVRGQSFHQKIVRKYSDFKSLYGENLIVLVAFGTSVPSVLANINRIASETELYIPDVPVFGNTLFDGAFYEKHRAESDDARAVLSDKTSQKLFDAVISFRLTGKAEYLLENESTKGEILSLLQPDSIASYADVGAYNGDTIRELSKISPLERVYAVEPDERNFKKLTAYAEEEKRFSLSLFPCVAWDREELLSFDGSGNRNASVLSGRSDSLGQAKKIRQRNGMPLDALLQDNTVDYIKYDVEGAEEKAILGSVCTIEKNHPKLRIALYHRSEDLFAIPLLIRERFPFYRNFLLRRTKGIPAWDLDLIVF